MMPNYVSNCVTDGSTTSCVYRVSSEFSFSEVFASSTAMWVDFIGATIIPFVVFGMVVWFLVIAYMAFIEHVADRNLGRQQDRNI